MEYKTAKFQDLLNDAQERGEEAINLLDSLVNTVLTDEEGKEYPLSYIKIKKEYFAKFLPDALPKPKPKKQSMKDMLNALKK